MAVIECKSAQPEEPSVWVEVPGITDRQVAEARADLDRRIRSKKQESDALAAAFAEVVQACPQANPSDLWQHVLYRHLLNQGWNDNKWKRVSGFALERALVRIYEPRLERCGLRMRALPQAEAERFLNTLDDPVQPSKVDLFLESEASGGRHVFGAAHVKASIAERIQDDVPASSAFMSAGLVSVALTLDAKSYPPPHGDCVNYGELGGRSPGIEKARQKRDYVESAGQFDGLFSFNLRTPPSDGDTPSGKRIYTLSLNEAQPDQLVRFLRARWEDYASRLI